MDSIQVSSLSCDVMTRCTGVAFCLPAEMAAGRGAISAGKSFTTAVDGSHRTTGIMDQIKPFALLSSPRSVRPLMEFSEKRREESPPPSEPQVRSNASAISFDSVSDRRLALHVDRDRLPHPHPCSLRAPRPPHAPAGCRRCPPDKTEGNFGWRRRGTRRLPPTDRLKEQG